MSSMGVCGRKGDIWKAVTTSSPPPPSRGTDHGRIHPFPHSCISWLKCRLLEDPVVAQELNRLGQQGPPILFSSQFEL